MIKLQDFAKQQGVTDRAIQKHLKKHEKELEGHFVRSGPNGTWLDDKAQEYIKSLMIQKSVNDVIDNRLLKKIEELESKIKTKEDYITALEAGNISKQNQINELEAQMRLLPDLQKQVDDKTKQLDDLQHELEEQAGNLRETERLYDEAKREVDRVCLQNQELQKELKRPLTWGERLMGKRRENERKNS